MANVWVPRVQAFGVFIISNELGPSSLINGHDIRGSMKSCCVQIGMEIIQEAFDSLGQDIIAVVTGGPDKCAQAITFKAELLTMGGGTL